MIQNGPIVCPTGKSRLELKTLACNSNQATVSRVGFCQGASLDKKNYLYFD